MTERAKVNPVEWYEQTAPNVWTKFRRTSLGVVRTEESIVRIVSERGPSVEGQK